MSEVKPQGQVTLLCPAGGLHSSSRALCAYSGPLGLGAGYLPAPVGSPAPQLASWT